jgi:hypothetical protein
MRFKKAIEKMSYKYLFGVAAVFAMVLMIPITVYLNQQETKIEGQAFFKKPTTSTPTPYQYGSNPKGTTTITLVWPFVGKAGDSVLVYGDNFGNNPQNRSIYLDSQQISEADISNWTNEIVEFRIPNEITEGVFETIKISVASQELAWDHPFTVYSRNTTTQVKQIDNSLQAINVPQNTTAIIDLQDGTQIRSTFEADIAIPENKTIISIKLIDQNNTPIPFFVDPIEFEF